MRLKSLGLYLAVCFSLLSILLTLILLLVIDITVTKQAKASIGANLAELAYQMSYRLDRAMFERYREVQLMADLIGRDGKPGCHTEGRKVVFQRQAGLVDIEGVVALVAQAGMGQPGRRKFLLQCCINAVFGQYPVRRADAGANACREFVRERRDIQTADLLICWSARSKRRVCVKVSSLTSRWPGLRATRNDSECQSGLLLLNWLVSALNSTRVWVRGTSAKEAAESASIEKDKARFFMIGAVKAV
ncbi:MAG: hypothetical protein ABIR56_01855 [Polaromonas sp.]